MRREGKVGGSPGARAWGARILGKGEGGRRGPDGRPEPSFSGESPTSASSSGDSEPVNQAETRSTRLVSGGA